MDAWEQIREEIPSRASTICQVLHLHTWRSTTANLYKRRVSILMPTYVQVRPIMLWFPKWTPVQTCALCSCPTCHNKCTSLLYLHKRQQWIWLLTTGEWWHGHSLICWIMHSSFTRLVKWHTVYTIIFDLHFIDVSAKLHTFKGYIQELEKSVRLENAQVVQQLDHINSLLNKAVLACKASLATSTSLQPSKPLKAKEYIAPGQNLQQQPRGFSKTTLTPGRKRNGLVLR